MNDKIKDQSISILGDEVSAAIDDDTKQEIERLGEKDSNKNINDILINNATFDYEKFLLKYPDSSPLDFMIMLCKNFPGQHLKIKGIYRIGDLRTLALASDYIPSLVKIYDYLYNQGPEKADDFLNDCEYEINNIKGEMDANEFLKRLNDIDDTDEAIYRISRELGISERQFKLGPKVFWKLPHFPAVPILQKRIDNSNLKNFDLAAHMKISVPEYKRIYILIGLSSLDTKEKNELIRKTDSSEYEIAIFPNMIDYTIDYASKFFNDYPQFIEELDELVPDLIVKTFSPIKTSLKSEGIDKTKNNKNSLLQNYNDYKNLIYKAIRNKNKVVVDNYIKTFLNINDEESFKNISTIIDRAKLLEDDEKYLIIADRIARFKIFNNPLPNTEQEWLYYENKEKITKEDLDRHYINTYVIEAFNKLAKDNYKFTDDEVVQAVNNLKLNKSLPGTYNEIISQYPDNVLIQLFMIKYNCDEKDAYEKIKTSK